MIVILKSAFVPFSDSFANEYNFLNRVSGCLFVFFLFCFLASAEAQFVSTKDGRPFMDMIEFKIELVFMAHKFLLIIRYSIRKRIINRFNYCTTNNRKLKIDA